MSDGETFQNKAGAKPFTEMKLKICELMIVRGGTKTVIKRAGHGHDSDGECPLDAVRVH